MTRVQTTAQPLEAIDHISKRAAIPYVVLLAAALLLWWLCNTHPAMLPFWTPWDFSFVEFLSAWLAIWWYVRGLVSIPLKQRPSPGRRIAFFVGVLLLYGVLETHFEYYAEHQFFFNRIQHVVMHHLGPLLIALAWPGEALWLGMPAPLRRIVDSRLLIRAVRSLQQPVLSAILFSGSFFFWLIPRIHFYAMIDPGLYAAMNWTMVVDGILFWCLVLDPRPSPPARESFTIRGLLAFVVIFPQIIGGAIITFSSREFYTFYSLCGRIYPQLGASFDQAMGGLIIWIPPAMMSLVAVLFILNNIRLSEERRPSEEVHDQKMHPAISARQWTGR